MQHIFKVSDSFGICLASPVPKFKGLKNAVAADDFRAISVNPMISKIIEHCIADYIHFKVILLQGISVLKRMFAALMQYIHFAKE